LMFTFMMISSCGHQIKCLIGDHEE
jgi:hypothetical protein